MTLPGSVSSSVRTGFVGRLSNPLAPPVMSENAGALYVMRMISEMATVTMAR